jgi:hypothetical protein
MTGIRNHTVSNLNIVHTAFVATSNQGPVICHLPESASIPGGKTILSTLQLKANGCTVVTKSASLNNGQQPYIWSPDGYYFPMSMSEGLAYLDIHPVLDKEWDNLPHIFLTKDEPWDPSTFDHGVQPEWDSALPNFGDRFKDTPYNADGNVKAAGEGGLSGEFSDDDVDPKDIPGLSANTTILKVNHAMIKAPVTSHIVDELDTSTTALDDSDESVFFFTDSDSDSDSPYIEPIHRPHSMAWQGYDVLGRPRCNCPRVDYSENKQRRPSKQKTPSVDPSGEHSTVQPIKAPTQPSPTWLGHSHHLFYTTTRLGQ